MEKWYLIYAYEHRYEGQFGVNDWLLLWTTPVAAMEEAERLSRAVIEQNGVDVFFHDHLHSAWDEAVEADIAYQVWELADKMDEEYFQAVMAEDPTTIIDQYGVKLVWER